MSRSCGSYQNSHDAFAGIVIRHEAMSKPRLFHALESLDVDAVSSLSIPGFAEGTLAQIPMRRLGRFTRAQWPRSR